jgi:sugar-specific transcriptional regulator TrmB
MENQHKILTLTRLGLTSNQAKVYLALFRAGLSTAKTISKNSGIARPDVYRVMATLEKLGLVEKVISAPYKFRAISIHDAFAILMERRMKETSELQATTREIVKNFKNNNARMVLKENETRFSLFSEQVAVRRKGKTLENVQRSFDAVTSWRNPHSIMFIDMKGMAEALQRSIEIRVIIDKPDEEKLLSDIIKRLEKYPSFKIRCLPNAPKALMSIYDKKEAWVCTCTSPVLEECPTLRTNNLCLLSILQDYFEMMWLTALESNHQDPSQT